MLSRIAIPHTCFIDSQALLFLFFYMIRKWGNASATCEIP